jgi:LmbE family N-acetylglucosaminyl deacetylase
MEQLFKLSFPSVMLDTIPQSDLIHHIREAIQKVEPEVVYLVHQGDVHSDHQAVFKAVLSVLKPFYMVRLGVRRILCYESLSSTEAGPPQSDRAFVPSVFNDITNHIDRKIEIMQTYESESQKDPMPRGPSAIRALARFRGATIGVEYAEAFMLVREIILGGKR